jgi:AcrR family transcriptional regulator
MEAPVTGDTHPRDRLLAAAVEHVAANGTAGLSLRGLAAAIGTSHRMLLYHFGSKENLLIEVIREVERRQREALADLAGPSGPQAQPTLDSVELGRRFWRRLADPSLAANERLFFEMYGRALQGDSAAAPMLDGIVEDWLEPVAEAAIRQGVPAASARANARLGLAVTRGLLLDLLATGDRAAVDEAMELFLVRFASQVGPAPPDADR